MKTKGKRNSGGNNLPIGITEEHAEEVGQEVGGRLDESEGRRSGAERGDEADGDAALAVGPQLGEEEVHQESGHQERRRRHQAPRVQPPRTLAVFLLQRGERSTGRFAASRARPEYDR